MSTNAENVTIRPAVDADDAAITQVISAAFGRTDESRLVSGLIASGDVAESFVAETSIGLIGHSLFSRLDAPFPALALAPVCVLPAHQNRGVGSALIEHGLKWASEHGWTAVFVLGEPDYYGRFGFSAEAAHGYDCAYSGPYLMAKFFKPADKPTGTLAYPAPFAALG